MLYASDVSAHYPLQGLRVLEWGDSIAAPYAARLLADAGADVMKIESPEGDSSRLEGPFPGDEPDPGASGLFAYLNRGKRSITVDAATAEDCAMARRLLISADVFIYDRPNLLQAALKLEPLDLRRADPRLIVLSLTTFGARGPRAGFRGDDLIVSAASNLAFSTPGFPDHVVDAETEPPLRANANLGDFTAGLVGAVGAIAAILRRERTGRGDFIDVSKQEAVASLLFWDLGLYSYGGSVVGRHPAQAVLSPNHYMPLADGWAVIIAFSEPHWRALLDLMGNPAWGNDPGFSTAALRGEHWSSLEPLILAWLMEQNGRKLFEMVQRRGIPCAPAFTIAEAVGNEHVVARQSLVPSGLPCDANGRLPGDLTIIDGQRRPTDVRYPQLGSDRSKEVAAWMSATDHQRFARCDSTALEDGTSTLPLAGIRVIDFGQMVAMPVAGQFLAWLGAEVILVETRTRVAARAFAPFAGEPSPNTSGLFNQTNRSKRSCVLNLRKPEGVALAKRLVALGDIVLENFSPGTMAKLGLGHEDLLSVNPDLITVSLSACGHTGPWSNMAAFHSGIILLTGLAAVTGYGDGYPRMVGAVLPDPVAATYCVLATLEAIHHRNRTGRGQHIEIAMTEAMQTMLPEAILEYTMLGREAQRIGNRHRWKAPHGIYRAKGEDRWLAISVEGDAEWEALCAVMGRPALSNDPRFRDRPSRQGNVDILDAMVEEWARQHDPEEAAIRLQRAGIAATKVFDARDVLSDPHMRERGVVLEDDHPLAGKHSMTAAPWLFEETPPFNYLHAPLLGADNDYVFCDLLGLRQDEVRELEAAQVLY